MKINKKKMILSIIQKNLGIKKIQNLNLSLGSIPEWDSMKHIVIFLNLKKKFSKINVKNASKIKSVKDWINLINRLY